MDALLEFLIGISWPAYALFATIYLRTTIETLAKRLTERISKSDIGSASFEFYEFQNKDQVARDVTASGEWSKPGNLFWMVSDSRHTVDALRTGKPVGAVLHGLKQTIHHTKELNLGDSSFLKKLIKIEEKITGLLESDLNAAMRESIIRDLSSIRHDLGKYITSSQDGFQSHPVNS